MRKETEKNKMKKKGENRREQKVEQDRLMWYGDVLTFQDISTLKQTKRAPSSLIELSRKENDSVLSILFAK